MNNKIGVILVLVLLVNVVAVVTVFSYMQSEINSLQPTPAPTPPPTPKPEATAPPSHNYTVFEWYLKAEYINNITWLKTIINYNDSLTWTENYISLISNRYGSAFPVQAEDSLAAGFLSVPAFKNATFNQETGWTKATYKYYEQELQPYLYSIETAYPSLKAYAYNWQEYFL